MTTGRTGRRSCLAAGPLVLIVAATLLAGCRPRPRAPVLDDSPVYENDQEGFRFMVPEGWSQYARSDVPPGKLDKERLLVQYRRTNSAKQATLEVSADDLPPSTDLADHLAAPAFGLKDWKLRSPPEQVEVNGVAGTRYNFGGRVGKEDMTREVVAFRRGGRVYFFTTLFYTKDATAQEQSRRAVSRILWKG
jgi:hypothetical protein